MGSKIKGITIELGGDTTELINSLKSANTEIQKSQNALKDIDKLLKLDPGNTELLQQKFKQLTKEIDATNAKLKSLKEEQRRAMESGNTSDQDFDALQREIIETEQNLKSLEKEYKDFGSVATQQVAAVGEKMQELGGKMQDIGGAMTKGLTVPIAAGGAAAVKSAIDFEDAMAKVSTIADETEMSSDDMRQAILELSNETGIGASEIAGSVYDAISAGQKTADAVAFVGRAAKLSRAGFTTLASSLDIMTTTLNAYQMETSDATRVSDVLIQTQNLGKTTVDELAASMGKVIPTAKSNGVALETLAGAYAVMTANGIATAETTTYLNSMLNELGKQGSSAANAFAEGTADIKEGGLTMAEAMEMGWSLKDVLAVLSEQADLSGTTIQNMFGSAEAGKAANVLWDNSEKLADVIQQMGGAAGSTLTAFDKLDTTSLQTQKTLNELKNTAIEIGSVLLEILGPLLDQASQWVHGLATAWSGLTEEQQMMIVKIAGIAAVAGPTISVLGSMVSGFGTLMTVAPKVSGAFSTLIGFFGKFGSSAGGVSSTLSTIGGAASSVSGPAASAGASVGALAQNALGFVALGAGILLAATGLYMMAKAAIELGQAGAPAAIAMAAMVGVLALLAAGAAALGPALTAGAVGLVAFGAAVALVGVGVLAASAGLSMIADRLPITAEYGSSAAAAIVVLSGSLVAFAAAAATAGAGAVVLAAGLVAAAAGETAFSLAAVALTVAVLALAVATATLTIGVAALAVAILLLAEAIALLGGAILSATTNIIASFDLIMATVTKTLTGIKDLFQSVFNGIKDFVSGVIDWLKGIFDFEWNLPKIKLPHFSISGSFSLNPPSMPSIGVDWYSKAMDGGMILNSPTIFGMSRSGTLLGGGEAGAEAVVGLGSLQSMITSSVAQAVAAEGGLVRDLIVPIYIGSDKIDEQVIGANQRHSYRSGGR